MLRVAAASGAACEAPVDAGTDDAAPIPAVDAMPSGDGEDASAVAPEAEDPAAACAGVALEPTIGVVAGGTGAGAYVTEPVVVATSGTSAPEELAAAAGADADAATGPSEGA